MNILNANNKRLAPSTLIFSIFQYTNTSSCLHCGKSDASGQGDYQLLQLCIRPDTNESFSLEDGYISSNPEEPSICSSAFCNGSLQIKRVTTELKLQINECNYLVVSTMNYNKEVNANYVVKSTARLRPFDINNVLPNITDVPMKLVAIVMYKSNGPHRQKMRLENNVNQMDIYSRIQLFIHILIFCDIFHYHYDRNNYHLICLIGARIRDIARTLLDNDPINWWPLDAVRWPESTNDISRWFWCE
jgi:hypothetical protein